MKSQLVYSVLENLPQLYGTHSDTQAYNINDIVTSGVFRWTYSTGGPSGQGGDTKGVIYFDANQYNSKYTELDKVIPLSQTCFMMIRY